MYADDLTVYLDLTDNINKESALRSITDILNDFYNASGLKVNLSKCKCVWFGAA